MFFNICKNLVSEFDLGFVDENALRKLLDSIYYFIDLDL